MSGQVGKVESAALRALDRHTDAREAFAEAGEDAGDFARTVARVVAACDQAGLDEIPLELALRAGVAVDRLRAGGLGLDHLLEVAMAVVAGVGRLVGGDRADHLGRALVLVITRAYLDAEAHENHEQQKALRALVSISRAVNRSLDPVPVGQAGLGETLRAMGLDAGAIWLGSGDSLSLVNTLGIPEPVRQHLLRLDVGASPAVRQAIGISTAVPVEVPDTDPVFAAYRSALLVPLVGAHGSLGLLAVGSRRRRRFEESEIDFITSVSDHLASALDHAVEHRREAHTDYLTGLSNRSEFESAVRRELAAVHRHRRPLSLMVTDLDGLKSLNDHFGHHAGDEAIRAVARVVRTTVRTSDISARLGGDEFAVAMPEAGLAQAREVAARIHDALKAARLETAPTAVLELSFGVTEWQSGQDYDALFDAADRLLYRDKRRHQARRARGGSSDTGASKPLSSPPSSPATP